MNTFRPLIRLLVAIAALGLVAISPATAKTAHHGKKHARHHVKKHKAAKHRRAVAKLRADETIDVGTDPVTTVTDPPTVVDPGTNVDPGTEIPPAPSEEGLNPAQACRVEQADPYFADRHEGLDFAHYWGANANLANAFGKCVSAHAHAQHG